MSEINYQALREAAERAIPAMERLLMLPADDDLLSEQELKDYGVDIDALNAFKFLAGPETVLALLDERERNQQYIKSRDHENEDIALTVGKLRVELEAEKQRAKVLFMENARLKSGIAGLNSLRRVLFYGDDKCTSELQVNGMESHSTELSKQRTSMTAMTTGCCGRR